MKLVDILARELKVWPEMPEGGTRLEQDINDAVIEGDGYGTVYLFMLSERADDQEGAHVSKAEWQAAVEALKAEQAAELKWPDGATHFTPRQTGNSNSVFWKVENGKAVTGWPYYGGEFHSPSTDIPEDKVWQYPDTIPRPTEPAVEWDGESRPPVGTVCEAQIPSNKYQWECCEIVWHHPDSDGSAAVVHGEGRLLSWSGNFRPIRTQEQIATEEREKAITDIAVIMGKDPDRPSIRERAAIIYDAGYRKQVEK